MAPLPDTIKTYLNTLLTRVSSTPLPDLLKRADDTQKTDTHSGVTPFASIPNNAVFALFGIIGAGFVLTGIWFFFWAKNGGFVFQESDWDDYKSTVMRRKGPNGTTLSGATESTDLGGGSVVHGEKRSLWGGRKKRNKKGGGSRYKDFDEESSEVTGSTPTSELKWKVRRERKKAKKGGRLRGGDLGSEMTEQTEMMGEGVEDSVVDAMRAYRHEKPARVGGLNKESDASAWEGSTNDNSTAASELLSHREKTPTNTPTKVRKERNDTYTGGAGGIRKVVSTSAPADKHFWNLSSKTTKAAPTPSQTSSEDSDRVKAEAAKLQAKGRAAQRRNFSFQAGDDTTVTGSTISSEDARRAERREERAARRASRSPTKKMPGGYVHEGSEVGSNVSSDVGTKSYHHVIPGLSSQATSSVGGYAGERRERRKNGGGNGGGGYRRGRRDSLSDDGN
ncbi:hypothetical protein BJ875DRAFT_542488 [Amylocarpus encephaloides]|uniref:Endosomal spry domain-containing protein n=1 Tax=Amylocarpus encephaloides TaxID=45428 RepID=A0A9P7YK52_9HELO|nr:hypothetical protein BJ875DRAFT_542488 [Amylocarpus encephaloides]